MKAVKTDNDNLASKIAVRRHFLQRYHKDGDIRVFDACQGSGIIWRELSKEFKPKTYWGADLKRKRGRVMIDSVELLAGGLSENVIDVDTYGSPWGHWLAALGHLSQPTTFFLTIGLKSARSSRPISIAEANALGVGRLFKKMPHKLRLRLARGMLPQMLARAELLGARIVEAAEGAQGASARYIGVRVEPIGSAEQAP